MHYFTLLRIHNEFKDKIYKDIVKKLDKYLFNLSHENMKRINPYRVSSFFSFNHDEEQILIYIFRLATESGLFKINKEIFCQNPNVKNGYIEKVEDESKEKYIDFCPACEEEHLIKPEDFVISFELIEKPLYENLLNKFFKKSA